MPASKPPLNTTDRDDNGVTGADCADRAPEPLGFAAWTVKVYVVPLVRPVTVVLVAAGLPLTVVAG
jgi:hypothetical protein